MTEPSEKLVQDCKAVLDTLTFQLVAIICPGKHKSGGERCLATCGVKVQQILELTMGSVGAVILHKNHWEKFAEDVSKLMEPCKPCRGRGHVYRPDSGDIVCKECNGEGVRKVNP